MIRWNIILPEFTQNQNWFFDDFCLFFNCSESLKWNLPVGQFPRQDKQQEEDFAHAWKIQVNFTVCNNISQLIWAELFRVQSYLDLLDLLDLWLVLLLHSWQFSWWFWSEAFLLLLGHWGQSSCKLPAPRWVKTEWASTKPSLWGWGRTEAMTSIHNL